MAGLLAALDGAPDPARVLVYGGARPALGAAAGAAPLVCELPLQLPAGEVVDGDLVLHAPSPSAVATSGATPTWARLVDGTGTAYVDMTARLAATPDDPEDPAAVVVDSPVVTPGHVLRIVLGRIRLTG